MMDNINIIMMRIINGEDVRLALKVHRLLESKIRNEAPTDVKAGLAGSHVPNDAGISDGKK
jgi:hypothetical protein